MKDMLLYSWANSTWVSNNSDLITCYVKIFIHAVYFCFSAGWKTT